MNSEKTVLSSISTNWWICFICVILLIIFIVTAIGFVLVPLNNIRTQVHEINQNSIVAFDLLQNTVNDTESTIKVLDSAAVKVNDVEDSVISFIKDVCVLYQFTDFCKNLK